ncbi:unnamed protein product [Rotaria sp. Silwood2]|nr:unnamed protein product [Rotaria sp. Silwood2]CAF4402121.1 unnamed protein product [Rotaria sp. Silwood2]CAF4517624.1 unnamed protein product [Rotaria sp. Silwood2]
MTLHYGETPGDNIYSITPGGTRIYYDRTFLLSRRESPLTRSPPLNLPYIPEVTLIPEPSKNCTIVANGFNKNDTFEAMINLNTNLPEQKRSTLDRKGDDQFSMDM